MSNSVTVLTPNGRRQTIKVQPNMTILQILEQVCRKHNFSSDDYDLIHHKRTLDLTQMFRFSGLPNNAQLEMVEVTRKRTENDVTIMIQLEDGQRVSGTYKPTTELLTIVQSLCPDKGSDTDLVIIYMRQEIFGEAISTTTLKCLGLLSGRAILRVLNRDPESLKIQANVSAPIRARPTDDSSGSTSSYVKEEKENIADDELWEESVVSNPVRQVDEPQSKIDNEIPPMKLEPTDSKKAKYDNEVDMEASSPVNDQPSHVIHLIGDHNAVIFSMDVREQSSYSVDNPDSFYELNVNDLRLLLKELRTIASNETETPLMTAQMRELEENKQLLNQMAIYKQAVIRIQFSEDRLILQGSFSPVETISNVYDFVRQFLNDPTVEFNLFTTPPKHIPSGDLRLVEAQCFPKALLHFGCVTTNESAGNAKYLKPELLDKISTPGGAMSVAKKLLQGKPVSGDDDVTMEQSHQQNDSKPAPTTSGHRSGKVPNWFKPFGGK